MTKTKNQKTEHNFPYFDEVVVTCNCGAVHTIGSTQKEISVEICSSCHPFYTGTQNFIDTAGRLEKFKAKVAAGKAYQEAKLKNQKSKKATITPKDKEEKSDKENA
jgi:large subunit ribosomal protein L31